MHCYRYTGHVINQHPRQRRILSRRFHPFISLISHYTPIWGCIRRVKRMTTRKMDLAEGGWKVGRQLK